MRRSSIVLATILGITGCQLVEVVLAPGERTLIVQSVIDRSLAQQFAVLEYSSIGDTHSTLPGEGREGRWAGSDRTECGLHE